MPELFVGLKMEDATVINGGDDRLVEITGNDDREDVFVDVDESDAKSTGLMQRIEALEQEKQQLVRENEAVRERVEKLKQEIEGLQNDKAEMKKEIERSESDKKALESIAARAFELETEVSRLQHDLITSMTDGEEANKEASELNRVVEELKRSVLEKGSKVEVLEKERLLLLEKLEKNAEAVKEAKAVTESRVRELEKKTEALESRENNEALEARAKIDEKENEIRQLKKWVEDSDNVVAKNEMEMERMKKEREELEIVKNELEALLKKWERKGKEMEHRVAQLQKELEASDQVISELREKAINGRLRTNRDVDGGLNLQWRVVAASAGSIAAIAVVCYLQFARRR